MAQNVVKTIHHANLECFRSFNLPLQIDAFSTLNEAFDIGHITPPNTGYPILQYLAIGRGGHSTTLGANANNLINVKQHEPTDAVLFEHIPFLMVPTTSDISPTERLKYRVRTLETYEDIDYFCYYLRVMDPTGADVEKRIVTLTDGVITNDSTYIPSADSLSPTPVDISNSLVNVSNGRHLIVQMVVPINLTTTDINNIIDACITKYGDIRFATISELGIVAGYDVSVTTSLGGVNVTYTEIRTGQIMAFVGVLYDLQQRPPSITINNAVSKSFAYPPSIG